MTDRSITPSHTIREDGTTVGLLTLINGHWYFEQVNSYTSETGALLYVIEKLDELNSAAIK